jgi:hypothetical protein
MQIAHNFINRISIQKYKKSHLICLKIIIIVKIYHHLFLQL